VKIYTKSGDQGKTSLASLDRVSKSSLRIEVYGTIDELISQLGVLKDFIKLEPEHLEKHKKVVFSIEEKQHLLFRMNAKLALAKVPDRLLDPNASHQDVLTKFEQEIDKMNEDLTPLANFVIPGGDLRSSLAHSCRCICRRAERLLVKLYEKEDQHISFISIINRLSDWLFVFARYLTKIFNGQENLFKS
tara:strand:- start:469 stop:1038 length:570 start_codon:yes stop_codon:yes gene_type:complete